MLTYRNLISLIGVEYDILLQSGSTAKKKFFVAAIAITGIFLISASAIFYAMELLFHMLFIEVVFAILLSSLFLFIYIFLLNTFSKSLFKPIEQDSTTWYQEINLSDIIRTGFVALMAFLISKPAEVFLLQKQLSGKVSEHRANIYAAYEKRLQQLNQIDLIKLKKSFAFYDSQFVRLQSRELGNQKAKLEAAMADIARKQRDDLVAANKRIQESPFLLFMIKQAAKRVYGWLICLGTMILFLLPGFLIYSISSSDEYYKLKKHYETGLVLKAQKQFEYDYTDIFRKNLQIDRLYYSEFQDPPFNTKPRPKPAFLSEKEFLKKYSAS